MNDEVNDARVTRRAIDQAQALLELGRYEQALPLLAQALAESPDDDWLLCRMADTCYSLDDNARAQEFAQRALHLNPNSDHAHFRLAWTHLKALHFDGALRHARAAIRIDPDDGANLYTLAWAEYHAGHSKEALAAAERAIRLDPDNAQLHGLIADLSLGMGKAKLAERHYREALGHDPESAHIHCNLGEALAAQHKVHAAAEHLLTAVRLEPANEEYRDRLFGIVHHELLDMPLQDRAAALAQLDPAVRHFYQDQLGRRGWFHKLRMGSMVTLWLLLLLLLMLFFTWVTGEDVRQLSAFVVVVIGIYTGLFIMRLVLKFISQRHLRQARRAK